ncbi:Essential protein Yae1- N terminal [Apiospora kogelbergensis]|uniref:Essential protein Yae1- N terminal n=1 Tax=Apiospora kogelbergensis TaxID=1337665 RepID=UPI00312DBD3C
MAYMEDPLDDVFGSDTEEPHHDEVVGGAVARDTHPSDMRRLQTEHTTAGYRDGITVAKASSIQVGFDEGFSLGGTIGLKAGQLLGYLEGIAGALRASNNSGADSQHAPAAALLTKAQAELAAETIFGEQYWNPDGTWKYELASTITKEGHPGDSILFEDVANAHPAIKKWTQTVEDLLDQHHINKVILDVAEETPSHNGPVKKRSKLSSNRVRFWTGETALSTSAMKTAQSMETWKAYQ